MIPFIADFNEQIAVRVGAAPSVKFGIRNISIVMRNGMV